MKRFDPITQHQNGPGWSWDSSSIKECEDGDYVTFEDYDNLVTLLRDCYNFDPCFRAMKCGLRERVAEIIKITHAP